MQTAHMQDKLSTSIFITFAGNCKNALTFYQTCFGGSLRFETLNLELEGYTNRPVISGSLISDSISIHGSDLVHNEGRKLGNHISILLQFQNSIDRNELINKLIPDTRNQVKNLNQHQQLIELTDAFDVRWILSLANPLQTA